MKKFRTRIKLIKYWRTKTWQLYWSKLLLTGRLSAYLPQKWPPLWLTVLPQKWGLLFYRSLVTPFTTFLLVQKWLSRCRILFGRLPPLFTGMTLTLFICTPPAK